MRIVSLVPSATEMIATLGLREQLVGITHECEFPASVCSLPRVTRSMIPPDATSADIDAMVRERMHQEPALYELDAAALIALRPDLIVTQSLCDVCAVAPSQVRAAILLMSTKPRVVCLEPTRLDDLFVGLREIAQAAGNEGLAEPVCAALQSRIEVVRQRSASIKQRPRVVLLEWLDPLYCAGHWSPELVELAGGREMLGRAGERSRRIELEELVAAAPEVLVIASCGQTVERATRDISELMLQNNFRDLPAVQTGRVYMVDGNAYFNRPGPRLMESLELLAHLIYPKLHSLPETIPPSGFRRWSPSN